MKSVGGGPFGMKLPPKCILFWWCPRAEAIIFVRSGTNMHLEEFYSNLVYCYSNELDKSCLESPRSRRRDLVGMDELNH
jgi:hypothetical protein